MAVTTTNLIQGPADLWHAPFGSTEPADAEFADAPDTPWVDCGGTDGGVTLSINQEYTELEVDQIVDIPERRMTKREFTIETSLAEVTLANLTFALNGNVSAPVTSGTGATANKAITASNGSSSTQPIYAALLMDGFAPSYKRRRFIGRKMLQVGAVEMAASKSDKTVLGVSFAGHYVSPSIPPFKQIDESAA